MLQTEIIIGTDKYTGGKFTHKRGMSEAIYADASNYYIYHANTADRDYSPSSANYSEFIAYYDLNDDQIVHINYTDGMIDQVRLIDENGEYSVVE